MSQSQPLRIEDPELGSFATARTINSKLWFVNNILLEERVCGFLSKYREKHEVPLFSFVMQGNHFHITAKFPLCNRAAFYRDLNARTAEAVRYYVPEFLGGPLFERRYAEQALPLDEDIEEQFFYCALQPVHAGLTERISDYPGYNSFHDATTGKKRQFRMVNRAAYNEARRRNPDVPIRNFYEFYTLEFKRLPGYEHLSQKDYRNLMLAKLEERRSKLVNEWKAKGHRFLTREQLLRVPPGALPHKTKKSKRYDRRPLVLSRSPEAKRNFLEWYFSIFERYKEASKRYLLGENSVQFPPRTYRPPGLMAT